jgi:hypothetical protein
LIRGRDRTPCSAPFRKPPVVVLAPALRLLVGRVVILLLKADPGIKLTNPGNV